LGIVKRRKFSLLLTSIEYFEQRLAEFLLHTCRPLIHSNISTCVFNCLDIMLCLASWLDFDAWRLNLDWRCDIWTKFIFQAREKNTVSHEELYSPHCRTLFSYHFKNHVHSCCILNRDAKWLCKMSKLYACIMLVRGMKYAGLCFRDVCIFLSPPTCRNQSKASSHLPLPVKTLCREILLHTNAYRQQRLSETFFINCFHFKL
jgi:hypothetical protein